MTRRISYVMAGLAGVGLLLAACSGEEGVTTDPSLAPAFGTVGTPNKQDWKQCQNDHSYDSECSWTTGNLTHAHNTYAEGDFVPKVLRVPGIQNANSFQIVMTYGFLKGGLTTHDFLGLWDDDMTEANPCTDGSFTGFCTGDVLNTITATSNSMATLSQNAVNAVCGPTYEQDMADAIASEGAAKLVIKGINVSSIAVTNITFSGCPATGDAEALLTMTVTPNALGASSGNMLLLFGAHVARSDIWDNGGAAGVSGSPYHLGLVSVDGKSAGSMDLQMSADAVVVVAEALDVVKTATPAFDREYTWTIDKSVDVAEHNLETGESGTSNYDVTVDQTVTDKNWSVSGMITITNPATNTENATVTGVSDQLTGGINATVQCGETLPHVLAPGAQLVCTYSTALPDGTTRDNVATVTTTGLVAGNSSPAVSVNFAGVTPTVIGFETIDVTDSVEGALGSTSADHTFEYSRTFTCNTDEGEHPNTATIDQTGQSDDALVTVNCNMPALEVTKDATPAFDEEYDWTIEKSVDVDEHNLETGQSGTSNYTVTVDLTKTAKNWSVSGNITIHNPAQTASATIASVADVVSPAIAATVECGVSFPYELGPGADLICTYSADLPDAATRTNTATVTVSAESNVSGGSGTAEVNFAGVTPTPIGEPTEVDIQDSIEGFLGTITDDEVFTYSETFTCDEDAGENSNTATIVETGEDDTETVTVNCTTPALQVSKDATPAFERKYDWTIDKSVDVASHDLFTGESGTSNYEVVVDQTVTDQNWSVTGNITIHNPAAAATATIASVTDVLTGGINATVDCGVTFPYDLGPGSDLICTYSASLPDATARTNTATATVAAESDVSGGSGTADVDFTNVDPTVVGYPTINVTDSVEGPLGSASGDQTFSYSHTFTCDEDEGENPNTATIDETGQNDSELVTVTCTPPGRGQIAPTQTTCEAFAAGTSLTLPPLEAQFKGTTINTVSPGVFFYYAEVTKGAGESVSFTQIVGPNPGGLPNYEVHQGQAYLYTVSNGICTKVADLPTEFGVGSDGSELPAGDYILGVKFNTSAANGVVAAGFHKGDLLATHNFAVVVNGGLPVSQASIDTVKK